MTEEQQTRESRCPSCGAQATDESLQEHQLSALGYLHDDQKFECSDCGHEYSHGVPVGDADIDADDLWCDVCDLGFMRVHRVRRNGSDTMLDLKCPHHHPFDCPECDTHLHADTVGVSRSGEMKLPCCEESIDREDVPFCFYFRKVRRSVDDDGRSLIGYPDIIGSIGEADGPYGYTMNEDGQPVLNPEDTDG